jgi:hypothetical protein
MQSRLCWVTAGISRVGREGGGGLINHPEPEFLNLLRSPEIDSQRCRLVGQPSLRHRPARIRRLAESIPRLLKRLQIRALFSVDWQGERGQVAFSR